VAVAGLSWVGDVATLAAEDAEDVESRLAVDELPLVVEGASRLGPERTV